MVKLIAACMLALLPYSLNAMTIKGCSNPWPPYVISKNEGMSIEIVKSAFILSGGHTLEASIKLWEHCLKEVKSGDLDILLAVWKSKLREQDYVFSEPYFENQIVVIKRQKDSSQYKTLQNFEGKRVGVVEGYHYWDAFEASKTIQKDPSGSLITNLRRLQKDRIDVTLDDRLVAKHTLLEGGYDKNTIHLVSKPVIAKQQTYIAVSIKHPKKDEIISAFNNGLHQIKMSNNLDKIIKKFDK